jgi:23S rRNA (cytidine1920-2'-O)/16S rRNA (cytidine1409-2'-O)-methyltransferase
MRADRLLVARGLAASRERARELIEAGAVSAGSGARRQVLHKPSTELDDDVPLEVAAGALLRYVSRGGLKLAGALERTGLDVRGFACLDIGQSTGGFTDCLLQAGARRVVGVDVGHGQLHPRLRDDPRVQAFEGVNVRALDAARLGAAWVAPGLDLVVADLSFISLAHALAPAFALARTGAHLVALVKPQFELGPGGVDRRGIVRDAARYDTVQAALRRAATDTRWNVDDWFESPIRGGDGNREFFLYARK